MRDVARAKIRATWRRLGPSVPDRPIRCGGVPRTTTAAERAALIARDDAARDADGRLPHAMLSQVGTSIRFRESAIPKLSDFADDEP